MEILDEAPAGFLPIHAAAAGGRVDVVRLLAEQHASMVACMQNGGSQPLHQAVRWRRRAKGARSDSVVVDASSENDRYSSTEWRVFQKHSHKIMALNYMIKLCRNPVICYSGDASMVCFRNGAYAGA